VAIAHDVVMQLAAILAQTMALATAVISGMYLGETPPVSLNFASVSNEERGPIMPSSTAIAPHVIDRAADGFFYINADVDGAPVRFLVDTGASVVVLSARDAARIGVSKERASGRSTIETVGGKAALSWANLNRISIGRLKVDHVRAAVVDRGFSISLIGQDVLARFTKIQISGDQMRIS
jgi:aspartyl protease family protein